MDFCAFILLYIYILAKESAGIERRGGLLENNKDDGSKKIYITVFNILLPSTPLLLSI